MTFSRKDTNQPTIARLLELLSRAGPVPAASRRLSLPAEAQRILRLSNSGPACLYEYIESSTGPALQGAGLVRLLDWDTDFFGFPCAIIDLLAVAGGPGFRYETANTLADRMMSWCDDRQVEFITAKIPGPDPVVGRVLEDHDFRLCDCAVELTLVPGDHPSMEDSLPNGYVVRTSVDDTKAAARAFRRLFYDGRFHNDPLIDPETADRLWETAIGNQFEREADHYFVLYKEDKPIGLATFRKAAVDETSGGPPPGNLFVFGLRPEYRGQGLGRTLLGFALGQVRDKYSIIRAETSTYNLPALGVYESLGFRPGAIKLCFHYRR